MRTRMLRRSMTGAGVLILVGILVVANLAYQRNTNRRDAELAFMQSRSWCMMKNLSYIDWKELEQTEGSFETGATHTESLKERDGTLVRFLGFAAPVDRGRYAEASLLPALLPQLVYGAPQGPAMYKFVNRMVITPLPLQCYWGETPPTKVSVFAMTKDGAAKDVPVKYPMLFSGRLVLNTEPGRFFYVLEDAEIIEQKD